MRLKTSLLLLLLPALTAFSLLVSAPVGLADDEFDDDQESEFEEEYKVKFTLGPTESAPLDAHGKGELEWENEDGEVESEIEVETEGLLPGDYVLTAVTFDGTSIVLGQFTSGSDDDDFDEDADDEEGEDSDDDGDESEGEIEVDLPADLDPRNIAQIVVSDLNGVAILVADLTNSESVSKVKFHAKVPVTGESAEPDASGKVHVKSFAHKNKQKNRLDLHASGLAPNSTYTVNVDGVDAGTVQSNKKGKVRLKKLAGDFSAIQSLLLLDSTGTPVASAQF